MVYLDTIFDLSKTTYLSGVLEDSDGPKLSQNNFDKIETIVFKVKYAKSEGIGYRAIKAFQNAPSSFSNLTAQYWHLIVVAENDNTTYLITIARHTLGYWVKVIK